MSYDRSGMTNSVTNTMADAMTNTTMTNTTVTNAAVSYTAVP